MATSSSAYIHPTAVVENDADIRDDVKIWHFCHVRKGATLHPSVSLGKDVYIDAGVEIGSGTRIQNGVSVFAGVKVEDWCFIGPHVTFTNDMNPRAGNKSWNVVPTQLNVGMSIGAGAIIRCGISIGAFAMIGAGAIVTDDVPAFHLSIGFPSRVKNMICACGGTALPLGSAKSELVRACCRDRMHPQALVCAEKIAQAI